MIKLYCELCESETDARGFEFKQATKSGFYVEFSHSVDITKLYYEKFICEHCKQELNEAFRESVNVLNTKIKSIKAKKLSNKLVEQESNNA